MARSDIGVATEADHFEAAPQAVIDRVMRMSRRLEHQVIDLAKAKGIPILIWTPPQDRGPS